MTRFVVVGFDGLRVSDAVGGSMPNLGGFVREWSWCADHRAVFPVETYVNHPTIFTGFLPGRHGVVANLYPNRPGTSSVPYFLGSEAASVEGNLGSGALFDVPTVGRRLGDRGLSMRVFGSNSAGSVRLKHPEAGEFPGHLSLPVRDVGKTLPAGEIGRWRAVHGEGHPVGRPDRAGSRAVVDSFLGDLARRGPADLSVLWLGEPDHSSHPFGPDGEVAVAARSDADANFGRILDWWRDRDPGVQLVVLSDHGHGTVARHTDVRGTLEAAGLRVATPFEIQAGRPWPDADLIMAGGYAVGLWSVREGDPAPAAKAAGALLESPDTGSLFSTRGELLAGRDSGILPERLLLSEHPRSPDLRLVTRGDPSSSRLACERDCPIGGGAHGGLLPDELYCLCAFGGRLFRRGLESRLPSGAADVTPTILKAMGFGREVLSGLDGRPLDECLEGFGPDGGDAPREESFAARRGAYRQIVRRTVYRGRVYLGPGHRED